MSVKGKLLYGVGLNDADYQVHGKRMIDNSIDWRCPYYVVWANMLKRSYDEKTHIFQDCYTNITVCKEWHVFSIFKKWMEKQDWERKALDKDIIKPGNTEYSPNTCCFVETKINNLLIDSNKSRGKYPKGLTSQDGIKFRVRCNYNGKNKSIGNFSFVNGVIAYCNFKSEILKEEALKQTDKRIKKGLLKHSEIERNRSSTIINEYFCKNKLDKIKEL